MYPEQLVAPMRTDLTSAGFTELKTSEEVENHLKSQEGTTLLVINSVCGCAAGSCKNMLNSEFIQDTAIAIPLYVPMSHEEQDRVVEALRELCTTMKS